MDLFTRKKQGIKRRSWEDEDEREKRKALQQMFEKAKYMGSESFPDTRIQISGL